MNYDSLISYGFRAFVQSAIQRIKDGLLTPESYKVKYMEGVIYAIACIDFEKGRGYE